MVEIQKVIIGLVQEALKSAGVYASDVEIVLEHPADLAHGDYSSNIAMRLAKQVGKNPRELAEQIVAKIPENVYIERVEVAGAGFINLYLSTSFFEESVQRVVSSGKDFGRSEVYKGKKILAEKTAPNLFKPFHVGHLLNLAIGESVVRTVGFVGADTVGVAYPSDISLGVAKAIWSLQVKGLTDFTINDMGKAYADGSAAYLDDESAKEQIVEINKHLNAGTDKVIATLYKKGRELNLDYFVEISRRLGSEYDDYFFESEAGVVGKEIVKKNIGSVFTESNGAIIFKGEEYGLHTRVFVTSKDLAVYEAKDIGLIQQKFEKYNPDVSILITDIEQKQYFQVIKKVAELLFGQWGERSLYLQHGRLRFEGGKISSRYGNVPLAEDLIDLVKSKVKGETDATKEQIAIAALKYSFLRVSTGKNIVFDFDKSISVEGDSGPYLQYTYARCKSVLSKAGDTWSERVSDQKVQVPSGWVVTDIEKLLYRFPEVVERAALEYEPHYIANYLNDIASAYNSWYAQGKILDGSGAEQYKLTLTQAAAHTIKNGLYLLGIDAPERM